MLIPLTGVWDLLFSGGKAGHSHSMVGPNLPDPVVSYAAPWNDTAKFILISHLDKFSSALLHVDTVDPTIIQSDYGETFGVQIL